MSGLFRIIESVGVIAEMMSHLAKDFQILITAKCASFNASDKLIAFYSNSYRHHGKQSIILSRA